MRKKNKPEQQRVRALVLSLCFKNFYFTRKFATKPKLNPKDHSIKKMSGYNNDA